MLDCDFANPDFPVEMSCLQILILFWSEWQTLDTLMPRRLSYITSMAPDVGAPAVSSALL